MFCELLITYRKRLKWELQVFQTSFFLSRQKQPSVAQQAIPSVPTGFYLYFTAFYAAFFFFCLLSFAASCRIFASSSFSMASFKYIRKVRFPSSRIFTAAL